MKKTLFRTLVSEMADQKKITTPTDKALQAKLHQGHDPNTEYSNTNQILGTAQFGQVPENKENAENFTQQTNNVANGMLKSDFAGEKQYVRIQTAETNENSKITENEPERGRHASPDETGFTNASGGHASDFTVLPSQNSPQTTDKRNFSDLAERGYNGPHFFQSGSSGHGPQGDHKLDASAPEPAPAPDPLMPPVLSISANAGIENQPVALAIDLQFDPRASDTTTIIIGSLPEGATLSAGTQGGDGLWILTPAQLQGLTVNTVFGWSGDINLSATAISSFGHETATATGNFHIDVEGIALPPMLSVSTASGAEDTAIALHINTELQDTDGSEHLSITVGGVPSGAVLSTGTKNSDGTWTLMPPQLAGLTITPPENFSGSFNISVTAISTENGTTAKTSASIPISIDGTADTPLLHIAAANGEEDAAIALDIKASLADTDGSETLGVIIRGVPNGASLSAGTNNGDGSWTLSSDQLSKLSITPPENWSGSFDLGVTAISSENGTTAQISTTLPVHVSGIADAPVLSIHEARGAEDTKIPLNISAALMDTDGSENLSIIVGNIPQGAALSAGTNNGDGSWTLTSGQLSGLVFLPPHNASGIFNLTVSAVTSENGSSAATTSTLPVTVTGMADAPLLSVQTAKGFEDQKISLSISAGLTDSDSETLAVIIKDVPEDAMLSAGTHNSDGSWTLSPEQLKGLTITPPSNYSGQFSLNIIAISSENGRTAQTNQPLPVIVAGVADAPVLSVHEAKGAEDTKIPLNISAALADMDGSEGLSIRIDGMPDGAKLSAGLYAGNGRWSLSPQDLHDLTITPPKDFSGSLSLRVSAIATEENGDKHVTTIPLAVTVTPVADAPVITAPAITGAENHAIPLSIGVALSDGDGSESISAIQITGVPSGATLSAGTYNQNGSWTLTQTQLKGLTITPAKDDSSDFTLTVLATSTEKGGGGATSTACLPVYVTGTADAPHLDVPKQVKGREDTAISLNIHAALTDTSSSETLAVTIGNVPAGSKLSAGINNGNGTWTLTPGQLEGLTFTPPKNEHGSLKLLVTATSCEDGTSASVSDTLHIVITGTPDPKGNAYGLANGTPNAVDSITHAANPASAPASETMHGTLIPVQAAALTKTAAIIPDTTAETPVLTTSDSTGSEHSHIKLHIAASLTDHDGSEHLSTVISGVPDHATLSAGLNNGDGTWTLSDEQLEGLFITPPEHFTGDIKLYVDAYSREDNTTVGSSAHFDFAVHVMPASEKLDPLTDDTVKVSVASGDWMNQTADTAHTNPDTCAHDTYTSSADNNSNYDHAFQTNNGG